MKYMIFDLETENHSPYRRFCNPFSNKNYIVARGYKIQGAERCHWEYYDRPHSNPILIPDDISLVVGHNIKFDLLFEWGSENLKDFFKRGGKIWDTQYAEYLINAAHPKYHMNSLDSIIESYGGTKKLDSVKALWKMGHLTSAIDKDMLIDYLVGTESEGRNGGDIGNTEKVFLGQVKKAKQLGMITMIQARMDGLLCTTEMEYNGLHINMEEGRRRASELEEHLSEVDAELKKYIPDLPEGLEFNWNSNVHVSCLIFGGAVKYTRNAPYKETVCETNGLQDWVYKTETKEEAVLDDDGRPLLYKSGRKKGEPVIRKVKVRGEKRTKKQTFVFDLPGYTVPNPKWQLSFQDGRGNPIYKTDADTIEELSKRDIPFLHLLGKRQALSKDLGTYYIRFDEGKNEEVGMLTCVMPVTDSNQSWDNLIHHSLNHTKTVTTRLSSSDPNLQNVSGSGKSEVKKLFTSRFGEEGQIVEADFSQLEVIVQAVLSKDENLCRDIRAKVDFHCKRVAAKHKIPYEDALERCKNEAHPEHKFWKEERRKAKEFSFQRAYGAGAAAIAESTGMSVEEVKSLIAVEDAMYPGVARFNALVEEAVCRSAVPFKDPVRGHRVFRNGYWKSPTGTRYTWRSWDAPSWLREKGILDSFKPTELKNYPVQGTAGEIVQIILGLLWRKFIRENNYKGSALLCNTVHDSVWLDVKTEVLTKVAKDVKEIMESVPQILKQLYNMDVTVPFPVELEVGDNLYNKHLLKV